jgi:hypothetical protein
MINEIDIDWILNGSTHLNFEGGIACRLQCGGCMMRHDMKDASIGWGERYNIRFDSYKVLLDTFDNYDFCGNLSDPIYHPDFIKTLEYMKGKDKKMIFHTNGSGKSATWWTKVFKLFEGEKRWSWIFALDGLPEDSHKYRIKQNGEQVWEMMKLGRSMNVNIAWQYIVFKYNQNDIQEAHLMAAEYGIEFKEMHSTRWVDDSTKANGGTGTGVDMSIYKPEEQHRTQPRSVLNDNDIAITTLHDPLPMKIEIDPDCLNRELRKPIMFNSMGFFIPCCEKDQWVDHLRTRGFYDERFHIDNLKTPEDIRNVFLSDVWQNFYTGLFNDPENAPKNCKTFCMKNTNIKSGGAGKDPKGFV